MNLPQQAYFWLSKTFAEGSHDLDLSLLQKISFLYGFGLLRVEFQVPSAQCCSSIFWLVLLSVEQCYSGFYEDLRWYLCLKSTSTPCSMDGRHIYRVLQHI